MDSYQPYPIRRHAVLCSLAELPDGGLRVVMDDLRQAGEPGHWQHRVFVTLRDYAAGAGQLDPSTLPDEELQKVGLFVLARLLAINGCLHHADEAPDSDAHLTGQQRQSIAALTDDDIAWIDGQLLSHCDGQFRKVAYIVGNAISLDPQRRPSITDVFYAQRVRELVACGVLEAQGDLTRMRYCEVRIPHQP
ncbi:DUF3658 domain-containing protein [Stenotrophomonas maltophilia]|uniref:DUF3658 domain-containing protein n=1 Tax=Stenotrophomonas maltophilia TaxID=40324 RepID=UPI001660A2E4|nr:DUF3658 domain-containing protein [Stenotrophomonas maltophilia]MBN4959242.1 hypothetical protein [Stenotrophomonas maltophilia]MBN4967121.1 hypothetical protein [Stenotrophomonas maltophilia]